MRWRVGCTRRVTFRSIALLLNHSTSTLINLTTPINNPYNHHPHTKITPQHTLTLKTTSHTPPSLDHLALTFSASIHPCFHLHSTQYTPTPYHNQYSYVIFINHVLLEVRNAIRTQQQPHSPTRPHHRPLVRNTQTRSKPQQCPTLSSNLTHIISVLQSYSTSYNCDSVISSFRQILTSLFSLCCSKAANTTHVPTSQHNNPPSLRILSSLFPITLTAQHTHTITHQYINDPHSMSNLPSPQPIPSINTMGHTHPFRSVSQRTPTSTC